MGSARKDDQRPRAGLSPRSPQIAHTQIAHTQVAHTEGTQ
jgi:hypothetical protein